MPTYQYSCTECGHFLEAVQKFTDDALTTCPECGGRLRKVFNAVGVVFKGSGFYRTDSRSGGKETEKKANGSADTSSPSDGSGSTPKKEPAGAASTTSTTASTASATSSD